MELPGRPSTLPSRPPTSSSSSYSPFPSFSPIPPHALPPLRLLKAPAMACRSGSRRKWAASQAPWEATTLARASPSSMSSSAPASEITPAAALVRDFYDGINRRDLASVGPLIAEACVYEDLIFARPFVGRQAILDFFKKFIDSISSDLQFVIDDISCEDSSAIGVTWHLEWRGRPFPFSKGCSFYRLKVLDGKRQIVYGRDCVEPAAKPGDMALVGTYSSISSCLGWIWPGHPLPVEQDSLCTVQAGALTCHGYY